MARTLEAIKTEIKTKVRTYPTLDNFLFPEEGGSQVSVFNIIIFVMAASIFTLETLIDLLKADIQAIADSAPSGNINWVRRQILNFQYGHVIVLTDFVPAYATDDDAARIVTRCSVKQDASGDLDIKVAKGTPPSLAPLAAEELTALQNYYFGTATTEGIGFAGVRANFISLNPDRMRVQGTVYFLGQYVESTVKANVIAAIEDFFNSFSDESFDGTVFISKLVDAVQAVAGVSRFTLADVKARDAATVLAGASAVDIQGYYTTVAGYLIAEDTAANTLNDTLTMTVESV